ncbi:hypothetical protein DL93DRAFT_2208387 [Clavulina sp. PMI_390]|nr:hypothetical protein DL93DRAFT_2208387 [Clavulina sp. PMI_390]
MPSNRAPRTTQALFRATTNTGDFMDEELEGILNVLHSCSLFLAGTVQNQLGAAEVGLEVQPQRFQGAHQIDFLMLASLVVATDSPFLALTTISFADCPSSQWPQVVHPAFTAPLYHRLEATVTQMRNLSRELDLPIPPYFANVLPRLLHPFRSCIHFVRQFQQWFLPHVQIGQFAQIERIVYLVEAFVRLLQRVQNPERRDVPPLARIDFSRPTELPLQAREAVLALRYLGFRPQPEGYEPNGGLTPWEAFCRVLPHTSLMNLSYPDPNPALLEAHQTHHNAYMVLAMNPGNPYWHEDGSRITIQEYDSNQQEGFGGNDESDDGTYPQGAVFHDPMREDMSTGADTSATVGARVTNSTIPPIVNPSPPANTVASTPTVAGSLGVPAALSASTAPAEPNAPAVSAALLPLADDGPQPMRLDEPEAQAPPSANPVNLGGELPNTLPTAEENPVNTAAGNIIPPSPHPSISSLIEESTVSGHSDYSACRFDSPSIQYFLPEVGIDSPSKGIVSPSIWGVSPQCAWFPWQCYCAPRIGYFIHN